MVARTHLSVTLYFHCLACWMFNLVVCKVIAKLQKVNTGLLTFQNCVGVLSLPCERVFNGVFSFKVSPRAPRCSRAADWAGPGIGAVLRVCDQEVVFHIPERGKFILFSKAFRLLVRLALPPIHWKPGDYSFWIKCPGCECDHTYI